MKLLVMMKCTRFSVSSVFVMFLVWGLWGGVVYADGFVGEVYRILGIFNVVLPFVYTLIAVLSLIVFFYFFWGLIGYIRSGGGLGDLKSRILWGIIGIFVLVSVWGLVYFLRRAVLGTDEPSNPDIELRRAEFVQE